ncbi:unnamed protein product [Clonostachys rosea f. rosea IK726]|uniref:Uncharacterized protein n=2 Tax=Bionectria ochroleuca TaxID=29856 RepID=A0A0B7JPU0_BIOOC|nr:unnamed protein product [Clonostachys rosea f. rosea IK726]
MPTIQELSEQLNYGKKRSGSDGSSKLKEYVDFFTAPYAKKCPAVKAWGDFKKPNVQQFVLEMTDRFLRQEGSTLWPEDECSPLYNESLIWPRDEKIIKELMCKMFFAKNMHKQRSDHQTGQKRKSNHTTTPRTPTSSRNLDTTDARDDNLTEPAREPGKLDEADRSVLDLYEFPEPRMLSPQQEAEVRALAEESFPTKSSSTELFIGAERPGKDKGQVEDRLPSQTHESNSALASELPVNQLRSPLNRTVENISRSRLSASPSSTVSQGFLSPGTHPRAPQATMINIDDAPHCSSLIMSERRQETGLALLENASFADSRIPPEPEIWYYAIKSHKPKVTKSWESKARFSDMTLAQLKDELLHGFDDATPSDIRCILNGPDDRKAEVEIDHSKKTHLQRLKTFFESEIKEAIEEDKGAAITSPLTFLIKIEPA